MIENALPVIRWVPVGGPEQGYRLCLADVTGIRLRLRRRLDAGYKLVKFNAEEKAVQG